MSDYVISEEIMKASRTYMANTQKRVFAVMTAQNCLEKMEMASRLNPGKDNEREQPMPARYRIDVGKKNRYLMTVLLRYYLKIEVELENTDDMLMTEKEYDRFAGSHIFEQLRVLRENPQLRYRCGCLMADYSDLKERMETEIESMYGAYNDTVVRLLGYMEETPIPEVLKAVMEKPVPD